MRSTAISTAGSPDLFSAECSTSVEPQGRKTHHVREELRDPLATVDQTQSFGHVRSDDATVGRCPAALLTCRTRHTSATQRLREQAGLATIRISA